MSDKKCPNCGACKECGARPPYVVAPYYYPYLQPYPQTTWARPFTTYGTGSASASGGTYSGTQNFC